MSFKAQLFALIQRSTTLDMGGYGVDDDDVSYRTTRRIDPKDEVEICKIDLIDLDAGEYFFYDQEVEVDSFGRAEATCTEGDKHVFEFRVSVPITPEHLP